MRIGLLVLFQARAGVPDAQMWRDELDLALQAECLGFDWLMAVEHHFTDYAMCPDNAQALSFLAARTKRVQLFPAAFILPWNDPLRVAEKIILLDHLSEGRAVLGLGRGLSRIEFDGFRVAMSEARERFDEAAEMILRALESGFIEGDGKYYPQPRIELRPRPLRGFRNRSYMVGSSPASIQVAARLGLACMRFSDGDWTLMTPEVQAYRTSYEHLHRCAAPPLLATDLLFCDSNDRIAVALGRQYQVAYWESLVRHYEMLDAAHFRRAGASYAHYAAVSERTQSLPRNYAAEDYLAGNLAGDPHRILDKLVQRRAAIGSFDLALIVRYSDMPLESAYRSLHLFAERIMPQIKDWT
jgi:alkanesulfonate monooxygenase SsuD/methylene tetrahydromethanopterin reductase-like flavin-dependent oxidoreductase (luciferase family)